MGGRAAKEIKVRITQVYAPHTISITCYNFINSLLQILDQDICSLYKTVKSKTGGPNLATVAESHGQFTRNLYRV